MTSRHAAILLAVTLLAVTGWVSANATAIHDHWFEPRPAAEGKVQRHPLWPAVEAVGASLKVDVGSMQDVLRRRELTMRENRVFRAQPNSLDVLFVGDSGLAWNVVPEVLAQVSGKRVGVVGYEEMVPSPRLAQVALTLADWALKPDGVLILAFSDWNWPKDPNAEQRNPQAKLLSALGDAPALQAFLTQETQAKAFSPRAVELFSQQLGDVGARVFGSTAQAGLPDLPVYAHKVEPEWAPLLAAKKLENVPKDEAEAFFHSSPESVFKVQKTSHVAPPNQPGTPDVAWATSPNVSRNAQGFQQQRHKLMVLNPLNSSTGADKIRALHATHFPTSPLLDVALAVPPGFKFTFDQPGTCHMVGVGAVVESWLIGRLLAGAAPADVAAQLGASGVSLEPAAH